MDSVINYELIRNPANWAVVGSMVLIGALAFSLITGRRRQAL